MTLMSLAPPPTSSLVTLRNGNELSLDFGVVEQLGAQVVAITSARIRQRPERMAVRGFRQWRG